MAESEIATSIALYRYLCRYIVGTDECVKTIRLINTVRDVVESDKHSTQITSGSFGEGLRMKGSDFDIMLVLRDIQVYETLTVYPGTSFVMETKETKPGFTLLRLMETTNPYHFAWCVERFRNSSLYLSNVKFKASFVEKYSQYIHGPCLSDEFQFLDIAFCLHSKYWISQARQWISRSNNTWPKETVKQTIIDHGVLFVPVGIKGSPNEEVEWRISFSVGEKFLIYTFNHTQITCYALMKILLKDVIEANSDCKDLLCSYFMKTILFWVSEEIPYSTWSPNNLLCCFMRCFKRLIYCVEYSLCPHYFIPENNLFEHKIEGTDRRKLLENLTLLHSYGWRCILLSNQFQGESVRTATGEKINSIIKLIEVLNIFDTSHTKRYTKAVEKIRSYQSSRLKYCGSFALSKVGSSASQAVEFNNTSDNKDQYKKYRTCLSYILQDMERDAVTRWLLLSSLFYRMKQYSKSLHVLSYTLSKCTLDKLCLQSGLSEFHCLLFNSINCNNLFRLMKFIYLRDVIFCKQSSLVPNELEIEVSDNVHMISPVVYAHFLRFLCFYHLRNDKQCVDVIKQLLLTITERYFVNDKIIVAASLNCAGIAFQLLGNYDMARLCYMVAAECDSTFNCALQRLQFLNE